MSIQHGYFRTRASMNQMKSGEQLLRPHWYLTIKIMHELKRDGLAVCEDGQRRAAKQLKVEAAMRAREMVPPESSQKR